MGLDLIDTFVDRFKIGLRSTETREPRCALIFERWDGGCCAGTMFRSQRSLRPQPKQRTHHRGT
ncbi:hypothetical protein ACFL2Q_03640, partial [Thermodesulfobacteriota bacterium]